MSEAAFDYAAFIESVREVAPAARYASMGAEAFAAYHRAASFEKRALRDLPVIAVYSRDMVDNAVWVYDAQWSKICQLEVATKPL